ncbi:unnamed protein product [Lymnaea stagnalis]|uniref:Uncharacterized protein n=1 Tax=Lymnaea stagnalis TaxID=6523 RepID=A0AAV2IJV9_LYMST
MKDGLVLRNTSDAMCVTEAFSVYDVSVDYQMNFHRTPYRDITYKCIFRVLSEATLTKQCIFCDEESTELSIPWVAVPMLAATVIAFGTILCYYIFAKICSRKKRFGAECPKLKMNSYETYTLEDYRQIKWGETTQLETEKQSNVYFLGRSSDVDSTANDEDYFKPSRKDEDELRPNHKDEDELRQNHKDEGSEFDYVLNTRTFMV